MKEQANAKVAPPVIARVRLHELLDAADSPRSAPADLVAAMRMRSRHAAHAR